MMQTHTIDNVMWCGFDGSLSCVKKNTKGQTAEIIISIESADGFRDGICVYEGYDMSWCLWCGC